MKSRSNRTNSGRRTFNVDSLLEKQEKIQSGQLGEFMTLMFLGYFDKSLRGESSEEVEVETSLSKISHKKRKDSFKSHNERVRFCGGHGANWYFYCCPYFHSWQRQSLKLIRTIRQRVPVKFRQSACQRIILSRPTVRRRINRSFFSWPFGWRRAASPIRPKVMVSSNRFVIVFGMGVVSPKAQLTDDFLVLINFLNDIFVCMFLY